MVQPYKTFTHNSDLASINKWTKLMEKNVLFNFEAFFLNFKLKEGQCEKNTDNCRV